MMKLIIKIKHIINKIKYKDFDFNRVNSNFINVSRTYFKSDEFNKFVNDNYTYFSKEDKAIYNNTLKRLSKPKKKNYFDNYKD